MRWTTTVRNGSLADASAFTQVLVTSHSPDLLDNEELATDSVLAVIFEDGETKIGGLDDAGRTALQEHLYTAGELLRMDQLQPSPSVLKLRADQMPLFGQDTLEEQ